jgi:hypothetical protein
MIFNTRVGGIPCKCEVTHYSTGSPMRVYGSGMGDCEPPEPEEFEYQLLDRKGYRAEWLDRFVTAQLNQQLLSEFVNRIAY